MVPAAAPIRKLRVVGRSRRKAGFCWWKRPVSASLHRGLAAPGYDFALGIGDELVSYTVKKPRKSPVRYYAHSNHLYSVATVTSAAGSVVERWSYNAYGVPTIKNSANATIAKSVVGNDRGFTGYKLDSESGLYFAKARMYSAKSGRFINRDLLGYIDGFGLYSGYFVPNSVDPFGYFNFDVGIEAYAGIGGSFSVSFEVKKEDCPCSEEKKVIYSASPTATVGIGIGGNLKILGRNIGLVARGSSYSLKGSLKVYKDCGASCYTFDFEPVGASISIGGSASAGIGLLDVMVSSSLTGSATPYATIACKHLALGVRLEGSISADVRVSYAIPFGDWLGGGLGGSGTIFEKTLGEPIKGHKEFELYTHDFP